MIRKVAPPSWVKGLTIYEVNLRHYTPQGTINAFAEHLPRLKELGADVLWFMPFYPVGKKNRKGTLGSPYSISDYCSVNPEHGNLNDFRQLVMEAHRLGLKVIIDWVANHTAWDHIWVDSHPEFYKKDDDGRFLAPNSDWEDVLQLDYGNPDLWETMIGAMTFWVTETGIDGFRCDMAHLVPTLFWNRARRDLSRIKPVYMLAESENFDLLEYAFDTLYNWKLLHAMNDLAAGRSDASALAGLIENEFHYLPHSASFLNFLSNHDENSWQGSAIERLHYFLEPLTVLTFLLPGIALIYSGQEAGNYRRLKFFDKDLIEWKPDKMAGLYKSLAGIKKVWDMPGFEFSFVPNNTPEKILSFVRTDGRRKLLIILNLSNTGTTVTIENVDDLTGWNTVISREASVSGPAGLTIAPFGYLLLSRE
ncbi:MAG: alpha-amylase family glycosyl hydrolase [Bacteroidales bacterium]